MAKAKRNDRFVAGYRDGIVYDKIGCVYIHPTTELQAKAILKRLAGKDAAIFELVEVTAKG